MERQVSVRWQNAGHEQTWTGSHRAIHQVIRSRIDEAQGARTLSWLAKESGVPLSTLSNQMNRPKFTIETLYALAEALGRRPTELLPSRWPPEGVGKGGGPEVGEEA